VRHLNTILAHLPPPDTKRWTARRKASVVAAVLSGMITVEEVCRRYGLSVDEFLSWHNAMQRHGLPGLRITKLQNYRYLRPKKD
jgi:transposase-like protein